MATKRCFKCCKEKELSEFGNNKKTRDGLRGKCRQCVNEQHAKLYQVKKKHYESGGYKIPDTKMCIHCKTVMAIDEFHINIDSKDRHDSVCRQCAKKKMGKWYIKNKGYTRNYGLRRRYGITSDEYNEILNLQNGVCKICKNKERVVDKRTNTIKALAVDHNHTTGRIRGLICQKCNTTISRVNESVELLRTMAKYLEECND